MTLPRPIARFRRVDRFDAVSYVLACVYAVAIFLPFYYLVVSSFKGNQQIFEAPLSLPTRFDFGNFVQAIENGDLIDAIRISMVVTVASVVLSLILGFPAAYVIARARSRVSSYLAGYFALGFLVPAIAILVPVFLSMAAIGLVRNPVSLILFYPATRLPVTILILTGFLRLLPRELEEAAKIDGAGQFQVIRHVVLPLSRPGIVTVGALSFIDIWNEFFFALVLLGADNRTVQVAISALRSEFLTDYGLLSAGILISMVPSYLVFVYLQDRLPRASLAGALGR